MKPEARERQIREWFARLPARLDEALDDPGARKGLLLELLGEARRHSFRRLTRRLGEDDALDLATAARAQIDARIEDFEAGNDERSAAYLADLRVLLAPSERDGDDDGPLSFE